jgi:hypothetical protein
MVYEAVVAKRHHNKLIQNLNRLGSEWMRAEVTNTISHLKLESLMVKLPQSVCEITTTKTFTTNDHSFFPP